MFHTLAYHHVEAIISRGNMEGEPSLSKQDVRKCKAIIFPIYFTESIPEVIAIEVHPNEKTIKLLHNNSQIFSNPNSKQGHRIMDNIIKYLETYLIMGPESQEEVKENIKSWQKTTTSLKRPKYVSKKAGADGQITPKLIKAPKANPQNDAIASGKMV